MAPTAYRSRAAVFTYAASSGMISALGARARPRSPGRHPPGCPRRGAPGSPSRRVAGVPPHLGGGAPQHAGGGDRRDIARGRAPRRRDNDHPRRRRRHHAAQPRALRHRRAVRHPGHAVSRTHRLGLGRAPGTDQQTLAALRRLPTDAEHFPQDVLELQAFLAPVEPGQRIEAVPGSGTEVPIYILGSSLFGAQLAAELGLPFAFASHFSPQQLDAALAVYRGRFKPVAAARCPARDGRRQRHRCRRPTPRRAGWPPRSRCPSPTSCAAPAPSRSRRSTTSTPTGCRTRSSARRRCWRAASSGASRPFAAASTR